MRILMLNDVPLGRNQGSGAERLLEMFMRGLREHNHDVDYLSFLDDAPEASAMLGYDMVHCHNFSRMRPDMQRAIIEHAPDYPPIVFTVHDYTYFCQLRHGLNRHYPCPFLGMDREICECCVPFTFNIVDGLLEAGRMIVADSKRMADIYREHLPAMQHRIKHVLLGIDASDMPDIEPYANGRDSFLYMGRHSFEKGIFELLAGFKGALAWSKRPLKLVLTHEGADTDAVKLQAERMGIDHAVELTGRVPRSELDSLYGKAIAVVAPSIWEEPFNLTIPEAWRHGVPVIASDMGAHNELIMMTVGGVLYPPHDVTALSRRMLELAKSPAAAGLLGKQGRRAIDLYFNIDRVVAEYIELYKEVIHNANNCNRC